jgi:hypothetical protein
MPPQEINNADKGLPHFPSYFPFRFQLTLKETAQFSCQLKTLTTLNFTPIHYEGPWKDHILEKLLS